MWKNANAKSIESLIHLKIFLQEVQIPPPLPRIKKKPSLNPYLNLM